MDTNVEAGRDDGQRLDEGLLREVSDAALSKLAPRLGKDWRAFMRGELWINQWNIEEVENEPCLPIAERIYRLLRLWKNTSEERPTISCLIRHLESFGYSTDTWDFLKECRLSTASTDTGVSLSESTTSLPDPEEPYNLANSGINKTFVPQFCYVVETTENANLHSFQGALYFPEGTKFDVIDLSRTNVLLARDIGGNIVHIPREICRRVPFHSPVLWENGWFHEEVIRTQLEKIFSPYDKGAFLIRESSENGYLAISVKGASGVKNFKIKCTQTGYIVDDDKHFCSLTDLINFYKGIWIFTTEDGRLFLGDYVPKNTTVDGLKIPMDTTETEA
ncbi:Tyrosine-protein kinase FRK [Holothuria leucospilota]|uniref:Tyrosine-protein kinase FRK n=1 Tax=Holothuria leucospilota TaxID=206669 RepID=A0A9Q1CDW6_HOLLE|nr:Tyrosine-protein kinase FRK [Holothuria leucospilota]